MKYEQLNTPSYIVQEKALLKNLNILKDVSDSTGCKILLAEKAFSMYRVYPLIARYLVGTTASGLFEAKLSYEEFRTDGEPVKAVKENHVFEPAYKPDEMKEICSICTHLYFNSIAQLEAHRSIWEPYQKAGKINVALRINPEFSTQEGHAIYDPCSPGSRLGIRRESLPEKLPEGVTGLHFHTLCEQGVEPLIDTFRSVEKTFGSYLDKISWINMGGGHHISKADYDTEKLKSFLNETKEKYGLEIYLEPGEAIALDAGTLITRVLDRVETSDIPTFILDASAACHMPDVLEMPYTPPLFGSLDSRGSSDAPGADAADGDADEGGSGQNAGDGVWVRLASRTCLAGDVIGIYKLPSYPAIGDILTFGDMAIYSMVKNNTFNGMALPDIVLEHAEDTEDRFEIVKHFGYEDFKMRLS
ncbi:MAG: carboxynorspermidine decarboxylase [Eubacterium sp.]|nr:carboxynorspermidine decarboxylase [Eubacterium sp.]